MNKVAHFVWDLLVLWYKNLFPLTIKKTLLILVCLSFILIFVLNLYISYKEDKRLATAEKKANYVQNSLRKNTKAIFPQRAEFSLTSNFKAGLIRETPVENNFTDYFVEAIILEVIPFRSNQKQYILLRMQQINESKGELQIVIPESKETITNNRKPSHLIGVASDLDRIQLRLRFNTGQFEARNLKEWDVISYHIKT